MIAFIGEHCEVFDRLAEELGRGGRAEHAGSAALHWGRRCDGLSERSPDSMLLIDSSIIRAHQQAAAKKGRITPSVVLVAD